MKRSIEGKMNRQDSHSPSEWSPIKPYGQPGGLQDSSRWSQTTGT